MGGSSSKSREREYGKARSEVTVNPSQVLSSKHVHKTESSDCVIATGGFDQKPDISLSHTNIGRRQYISSYQNDVLQKTSSGCRSSEDKKDSIATKLPESTDNEKVGNSVLIKPALSPQENTVRTFKSTSGNKSDIPSKISCDRGSDKVPTATVRPNIYQDEVKKCCTDHMKKKSETKLETFDRARYQSTSSLKYESKQDQQSTEITHTHWIPLPKTTSTQAEGIKSNNTSIESFRGIETDFKKYDPRANEDNKMKSKEFESMLYQKRTLQQKHDSYKSANEHTIPKLDSTSGNPNEIELTKSKEKHQEETEQSKSLKTGISKQKIDQDETQLKKTYIGTLKHRTDPEETESERNEAMKIFALKPSNDKETPKHQPDHMRKDKVDPDVNKNILFLQQEVSDMKETLRKRKSKMSNCVSANITLNETELLKSNKGKIYNEGKDPVLIQKIGTLEQNCDQKVTKSERNEVMKTFPFKPQNDQDTQTHYTNRIRKDSETKLENSVITGFLPISSLVQDHQSKIQKKFSKTENTLPVSNAKTSVRQSEHLESNRMNKMFFNAIENYPSTSYESKEEGKILAKANILLASNSEASDGKQDSSDSDGASLISHVGSICAKRKSSTITTSIEGKKMISKEYEIWDHQDRIPEVKSDLKQTTINTKTSKSHESKEERKILTTVKSNHSKASDGEGKVLTRANILPASNSKAYDRKRKGLASANILPASYSKASDGEQDSSDSDGASLIVHVGSYRAKRKSSAVATTQMKSKPTINNTESSKFISTTGNVDNTKMTKQKERIPILKTGNDQEETKSKRDEVIDTFELKHPNHEDKGHQTQNLKTASSKPKLDQDVKQKHLSGDKRKYSESKEKHFNKDVIPSSITLNEAKEEREVSLGSKLDKDINSKLFDKVRDLNAKPLPTYRVGSKTPKSSLASKKVKCSLTKICPPVHEISKVLNDTTDIAKGCTLDEQCGNGIKEKADKREGKSDKKLKSVQDIDVKQNNAPYGQMEKSGIQSGKKQGNFEISASVSKQKETNITILLKAIIKDENELLQHLIGIITETSFSVTNIKPDLDRKITKVEIKFPSSHMSKRFQEKLVQGRKHLPFSFTVEKKRLSQRHRDSYETLLKWISSKVTNVLASHAKEMRNVEKRIEDIQSKHRKKMIDLNVFLQQKEEVKALQDKLHELTRQKTEFQRNLEKTTQQLEQFRHVELSDSQSSEIRSSMDIECKRLEDALPLYARKTEILETVTQHQVSIIIGETGSGKSTQIAQYIHQSGIADHGVIACTQPRKVAAVSLATRVASEMKTSVGQLVGYQVGMSSKRTKQTKIVYMTDHMLLNECLEDSKLSEFSFIIIDEAHERSIFTDLLLGMIKSCLPLRKDLHVVVTSATIDPDVFVRYFENCPVLKVSGRLFPVDIEWDKSSANSSILDDYEERALEKAWEIHTSEKEGDILVFLTSQLEIERCVNSFQERLRRSRSQGAEVLPLHGKLQHEEQRLVFKPTTKGIRKIIFATNIAETSITIPGVRYVVDTGFVKEMQYDPRKKINSLEVVMVTRSSADQRKGRAGRTQPGKCFRLFSEKHYENMEPNSVPEIFKVHLGLAMLKLFELNVDPLEFDFVQTPTRELMEDAVNVLENVGAVSDRKITEKGRFLAKLNMIPRIAALIYSAVNSNAAMEGIVLAASCTASGSLFYRAGSDKEKQKADKLKIKFCHETGDHLTALNVFKAWHKVPEKQKGRWCKENYINGKVMRGIRETVNEILKVLKKEWNKVIKFELVDDAGNDPLLQKLLFKAFQENICHFLGHEKAGYHFIDQEKNIVVHPSSSLLPLGLQPDWVIVEQVMKTSRDFALNITVVQEEDVIEAIQDGSLKFDLESVRKKRVAPVCTEYVGNKLHRDFVGPRYVEVKEMEDSLKSSHANSIFVVDADREKGEICIYATRDNQSVSTEKLQDRLTPLRCKLKEEQREIFLSEKAPYPKALIGPGGSTTDVLQLDQYRSILVYMDGEEYSDLSESEIQEIFSDFGKIERCIPRSKNNNNMNYWGEVAFCDSDSAKVAVSEMRGREYLTVRPKQMQFSEIKDELRTKLVWIRRPSEGYGFVQLKIQRVCASGSMLVGDRFAKFSRSKKSIDELFIKGFGCYVTEDVLRESIIQHFHLDEDDVGRVTVIRKKVETSQEMLDIFKRRLIVEIKRYTKTNKFHLEIHPPKQHDHFYVAKASFSNPDEGITASLNISGIFKLNDQVVTMTPELHTSLFVQDRVFHKIKVELENIIENVSSGTTIKIKPQRNSFVVYINTESVEDLAATKKKVEIIIKGETMDVQEISRGAHLFTREGRKVIDRIKMDTNTEIIPDDRSMTISVYGTSKTQKKALKLLRQYLEEFAASDSKQITLKEVGKPPGLMKSIIVKFGIDLQKLEKESGLLATQLDYRYHKLTIIGSEESLRKAQSIISDIEGKLAEALKFKSPSEHPECGICLCEIVDEPIYRLESCGHPYCVECVKMHLQTSVTSADFPLRCCVEDCNCLWAWQDILCMAKSGCSTIQNITKASVSHFVRENKKDFHYCITPDCHIVYRVTKDGTIFPCPECKLRICTSCHVEYHNGMSCTRYKIETGQDDPDTEIYKWLQRDPRNRKECPSCGCGIEKTGGCQHMTCSCGSHICWMCMAFFSSSKKCYAHLAKEHGSFV